MTEPIQNTPARFQGPNSGIVATVFVVLFFAGLMPVTAFGGMPYFPGPTASVNGMVAFFSQRQGGTLLCAFLQFGSAVPLGIFTMSIVARLKFLGVRAAGADIALFGGLATAMGVVTSSCFLWAMTYPGISQDANLLQAFYRVSFGLGGLGYSVFFGLLAAGVSVTAGLYKLLPKWIVILGLVVAVAGELSWFEMLNVKLLPLIPLTRFPGFVWMIAAGFSLSKQSNIEVNDDHIRST
ncbi:MAG: hypothetical protein JWO20_2315 [Candidatus Angelobacter sp.]|nr:hypothetical protein [Candidatus Angelobacter sp.]